MAESCKGAALLVCACLLVASVADAQLNRTAVSVQGSDLNNCATTSPCRSFAVAMSQTNVGGEVIAIDSGGFGTFTADRSVTVAAVPGAYAGVTVTSGNAITIGAGASANVALRGLVLNGVGTAGAGVAAVTSAANVYVEGCSITGFVNYGIISFFNLRVSDTTIRDCGSGIWIDNAGTAIAATVDHTTIKRMSGGDFNSPGTGVLAFRNAKVTVRDTVVSDATVAFNVMSGILNLESCTAANSAVGISSSNATARMSNCLVTGNGTGVFIDVTGTVESWQNNRIKGNSSADISGSLTTVGMN